jgi:carboxylesterase
MLAQDEQSRNDIGKRRKDGLLIYIEPIGSYFRRIIRRFESVKFWRWEEIEFLYYRIKTSLSFIIYNNINIREKSNIYKLEMRVTFMDEKREIYILVHGFGGGPFEIEPLAEQLRDYGKEICIPKLAGHTGKRADLRKGNYRDWLDSVESYAASYLSDGYEVCLVGFSMGGLICANVASKYRIKKIVTVNTPIKYWDFTNVTNNLKSDLKNKNLKFVKRYFIAGTQYPTQALVNFKILHIKTKNVFKEIDCPILITQTKDDDAVNHNSAELIFNMVKSTNKNIKKYDSGGHLALWSESGLEIIRDILDFLLKNKKM